MDNQSKKKSKPTSVILSYFILVLAIISGILLITGYATSLYGLDVGILLPPLVYFILLYLLYHWLQKQS